MPWKKGDARHPRKGNGRGVGGPAKGAGYGGPAAGPRETFTADKQPPPEAKAAGHDVAAEIRARIAARRHEIFDAQIERALDLSHPQGHAAAAWLGDKLLPPETKSRVEFSSDPDQMTDEQLAAIAAGRGGAVAGAQEDQD